ncbi:hypothetical protein ACLESO_39660 [Pyxidicoccus sp. 3LG]
MPGDTATTTISTESTTSPALRARPCTSSSSPTTLTMSAAPSAARAKAL